VKKNKKYRKAGSYPAQTNMGPREAKTVAVDIVDIAFPNDYGVGKSDGYVFFVPGAVPEDSVNIEVIGRGRQFGYGKILSIDKPSPFRIEPFCPHFGPCGGCTLQSLSYDRQLTIKENYLRQTLTRLGDIDLNKIDLYPITPSPKTVFYRGKIELAFGKHDGRITLGLRERVSPFKKYDATVVPLRECRACSPFLEKIIPVFVDFAQANSLSPYNPITKEGFLRHLIVRESKSTGELMCILETTTGNLPDLDQCLQSLAEQVPEITSFYTTVNNSISDVVQYEKTSHIAGRRYIEEKFGRFVFHIYPESFFQPNAEAAQRLYETIPGLTVLDNNQTLFGLYCGTGTIEIFLSPYVREVIGFDSLKANIANAAVNCRTNGITNVSFHAMKVEHLSQNGPTQKPDVLIIDPPRSGLSNEASRAIFKLRPEKIVYISCNPSTLARDLKLLRQEQYLIDKIAPFDFFRQSVSIIDDIFNTL
jgi:23S rRNA (uracil1939-C5)-methyltransferase